MLRLGADTENRGKLLATCSAKARQHLLSVTLEGLVLFLLMRRLSLMFRSDLSTAGIKMCDFLLV